MKSINIHHQPVELFKILKFEGLVGSGGEAKRVISDQLVTVNGLIETQKRKKIVAGDEISFNDQHFVIVLNSPIKPTPQKTLEKGTP